MAGTDDQQPKEKGAVQHLENALEAEEMDEVNYHVRQALQLLGLR